MDLLKCENCNKEHDGTFGSGRFCSKKCACSFSTKEHRHLINEKISKKLKGKKTLRYSLYTYICEKCNVKFTRNGKIRNDRKIHCDNCKRKYQYKNSKDVDHLLQLSSRTVSKILKRANIKCAICGWNKTSLDVHHIEGKKIKDANNHKNLIALCPNCHRLAHEHKLEISILKENSLYFLLLNWKQYYYS